MFFSTPMASWLNWSLFIAQYGVFKQSTLLEIVG
jgi:hypothetical protein